jgi:hypothetical protein
MRGGRRWSLAGCEGGLGHGQVSSSSSLREQHVGAAAAQLTVLRADLEAVEGQLRASQQEIASLRKVRMEEAAASAAEIRLVKVGPVMHHTES